MPRNLPSTRHWKTLKNCTFYPLIMIQKIPVDFSHETSNFGCTNKSSIDDQLFSWMWWLCVGVISSLLHHFTVTHLLCTFIAGINNCFGLCCACFYDNLLIMISFSDSWQTDQCFMDDLSIIHQVRHLFDNNLTWKDLTTLYTHHIHHEKRAESPDILFCSNQGFPLWLFSSYSFLLISS